MHCVIIIHVVLFNTIHLFNTIVLSVYCQWLRWGQCSWVNSGCYNPGFGDTPGTGDYTPGYDSGGSGFDGRAWFCDNPDCEIGDPGCEGGDPEFDSGVWTGDNPVNGMVVPVCDNANSGTYCNPGCDGSSELDGGLWFGDHPCNQNGGTESGTGDHQCCY